MLPLYGFFAASIPVWLLLAPRDYLSTFMKIGVITAMVIGMVFVNPAIKMPITTQFMHGGRPSSRGPGGPMCSLPSPAGPFQDSMP